MEEKNTRVMPIVMSSDEWNRIVRWTGLSKDDKEAQKRRDYIKYLNEASAKMTKSWPNSLENVNRRNEEIRRSHLEAAEKANSDFYNQYIKRKKLERENIMYDARDTVFKNKDAPKMLLSGVIESVVLKEREEQLKFNAKYVGKNEKEQKERWDKKIADNAKAFHEHNEEMKKRRFEVNKQHQQELIDQMIEVQSRQQREYEEELEMQRQDIINSNKELKDLKRFEEDYKLSERQRILDDNEQSLREVHQRKKEQEARDKLDDRLIEVLNRSKARVDRKRRETEQQLQKEKIRVLEEISKSLASGDAARDAKEQASLEKAIAEKEAALKERLKQEHDKKERFKKERREVQEKFLQDEAQRMQDEHTMQRWSLINRFKNEEIYHDYKEKIANKNKQHVSEYRETLIKQWKEREDHEAQEKADRRYFYGELAEKKLRDADNKLFLHAQALLKEAEEHGRPTLPIKKALDRYCRMYRLYPMPPLPASLQKHFESYAPQDLSQADPDYREPPPPPPVPCFDEGLYEGKRDGMQKVPKMKAVPTEVAGPSQPNDKSKKNGSDDYKRKGRADGLQRKCSKEELVLPPIDVKLCGCQATCVHPTI